MCDYYGEKRFPRPPLLIQLNDPIAQVFLILSLKSSSHYLLHVCTRRVSASWIDQLASHVAVGAAKGHPGGVCFRRGLARIDLLEASVRGPVRVLGVRLKGVLEAVSVKEAAMPY